MFSGKMNMSFKRSAFLTGAGSVLDLSGQSLGKIKISDSSSDIRALQSDWNALGRDLKHSCKAVIGKPDSSKSAKDGSGKR